VTRQGMIIVGAAVLGIVVFSAAALVTARPDIFSVAGGASQCREAALMAERVEPVATGAMAAFETVTPASLAALPFDGRGEDATTIAALEGRTVLLNLWATWCAPCRAEMPHLAALQRERGGPDFSVVAVSIDNRDANRPETFLEETGATNLDYHREPTMRLFNSLKEAGLAIGMPTTLLIAPDGCAAGVLHGAADWSGPDALHLVDAALASAGS